MVASCFSKKLIFDAIGFFDFLKLIAEYAISYNGKLMET